MKKIILLASTCLLVTAAFAENVNTLLKDTTKVIDIEEVVVIASPKETGKLRELPTAVSLISQKDMQANQVTSLKNVSALVPNFFIPDYGSRITSAIYIRGIGSRINTPAVGLYVDNIPYIDKSAFDFNFYDIERIDILRGPQGTLYGRNTMGGLIKVHTRSPFSYQGTDIKMGYGTQNNHRNASATHYHRWSNHFAFSAGGYYEGSDGFFRNSYNGKKIDDMEAGGGRIRAIWLPSDNLKLDFTTGYDYSDEGGYPYFYTGTIQGHEEEYKDLIGKISYNRNCGYRRGLLNTGLNIEYQGYKFIMNAVTGYQNLNDRMYLDQDFLPVDIYNMEQEQRINTLSEEITFKSKNNQRWIWLAGISGFYQWLHTNAPVTFQPEGIEWLEKTINTGIASSGMPLGMKLLNETMPVPGTFDTPTSSIAVFHQSTFNHLLIENLSATIGLRFDYEKNKIDYNSSAALDIQMIMGGKPMGEPLVQTAEFIGKLKDNHIQLLPKFALKYDIDHQNNIYGTASRGFRSGGYNIQMFSELLQSTLQQRPGTGNSTNTDDIKNIITYKPEYSWNYEIGSHLTLFNGKLKADLAVFYMDTHDQQIAKFVNSGLGRMMVNAGSSESHGMEASLLASINKNLSINASYGYTHSTFNKYDGGITSSDELIDYSGNYVPFVPRHTMNTGANYNFFFSGNFWVQNLTIGLNYIGAGKIYWTEKNNASQDFYGTLNGCISVQAQELQIDLWGHNLANKNYTTFYFESMYRGFEQKSKPLQVGIDIRYHF